jgi:hypothetical protein
MPGHIAEGWRAIRPSSVPGRTEDAEQKLMRHLDNIYSKSQLDGCILDITSEPSFIKINGKTIPIQGVNTCDACHGAMNKFAKEKNMEINYRCRGKKSSYPH